MWKRHDTVRLLSDMEWHDIESLPTDFMFLDLFDIKYIIKDGKIKLEA